MIEPALASATKIRVVAAGSARRLFSIQDPGSVFEIEFHETVITGTPTCLEHQALAWATIAEMSSMNLAPSDQAFVRFLAEQQSTGA